MDEATKVGVTVGEATLQSKVQVTEELLAGLAESEKVISTVWEPELRVPAVMESRPEAE